MVDSGKNPSSYQNLKVTYGSRRFQSRRQCRENQFIFLFVLIKFQTDVYFSLIIYRNYQLITPNLRYLDQAFIIIEILSAATKKGKNI